MRILGNTVMLGLVAVVGLSLAAAGQPQGAGKGKGWKKGQGWKSFVTVYDADKDGKVSKAEFLAKKPGFDRFDTDKNGAVTEAEFDASNAAKKNPKLKGWMARWDANKDKTVSSDEWNAGKTKGFDKADKNHDGVIEEGEFTPDVNKGGEE